MRNLDEEQTRDPQVVEPAEPLTELGEIKAELEALRKQLAEKDSREIDFVAPENVERQSIDSFPQDAASIKDMVRKHALKQLGGTEQSKKWKLKYVDAYVESAVRVVQLAAKKKDIPEYYSSARSGARMTTWNDYDKEVRKVQTACTTIGINPFFIEINQIQ